LSLHVGASLVTRSSWLGGLLIVAAAACATPAARPPAALPRPTLGLTPLHFAGGAQAALDLVIADCAADEACRRVFPDVRADVDAALARFAAGPVTFDLPNAAGRASERVNMTRVVFVERLRLLLYNPWSASRVPLVLHRAAEGDWRPFARAVGPAPLGGPRSRAMGMYRTVTCSESVAFISEEDMVRESRLPPRFFAPVHAYFHDCLRDLVADFVAAGSARELDVSCVETLRRPSFVTE